MLAIVESILRPAHKRGARWRRHLDRLAAHWRRQGAGRGVRLRRLMEAAGRLDEQPARRAEIAYLLGCHALDAGDIPTAVRAFECAYHDDDAYSTACVLVFACLKQEVDPDRPLLDDVVLSWQELRKPKLLEHARERELLTAVTGEAISAPRTALTPAAAFRLVPIRRLQDVCLSTGA